MHFEEFLRKNSIWHNFRESHSTRSAHEAAESTGVPFGSIIKTLVFEAQDEVYLVIARAESKVS